MAKSKTPQHPDTALVHGGLHPYDNHGVVNPPVYHASTILYDGIEAFRNPGKAVTTYGRHGTPGTFALEEAMMALEGAEDGGVCKLLPSGLAGVTEVLLAFTKAGGHILVADGVYSPTRDACDKLLSRFDVETTYFDPAIGGDIAGLIRPNTSLVMMEAPASRTFEIMDVPAIAAAARKHGVTTAIDNTWATPYFFKPLKHGVDISINAATKFIAGHSDVLIGTVTANKAAAAALTETHKLIGQNVGPDDVYLTQRGLRTLAVRMKRHMESGLEVARWLQEQPFIAKVMHPALPEDPGHAVWRRDFSGAPGVFGFEMTSGSRAQEDAFLGSLGLFGLGFSFGGFESLIVPTDVTKERTAVKWQPKGSVFRLHVGLEDPGDLIADLAQGFEKFRAAA